MRDYIIKAAQAIQTSLQLLEQGDIENACKKLDIAMILLGYVRKDAKRQNQTPDSTPSAS